MTETSCIWTAPAVSAVVPGGGQIINRQYVKSGALALVEGFLIYLAVKDTEKRTDYIYMLAGVKAFSVIDAYIDAEINAFRREKEQWAK
ncbi:MAG: hypothetical protein R6U31_05740 [bacterium]